MSKGLDAQQQIFAANPDDRRAFETLEEHFFLEGDWHALARVYRSRLTAPSVESDPAQRGALLFRLGQILEDRIVDLDAACETYWQLARLDRTHRPALRQLRGIHARRGQWDMVLQLAELESATAMPPFERAQFESELGRIWHRQLGDRGEAERAYARALEADASHPAALEGLTELLLEQRRDAEAARLLERLTTRLRGPERAPFWLALGRLHTGPLLDRARARACFANALEDDPLQTAAVEWSLLLATEDEDWAAVASLLEHRFDLASGARHRTAIAVEASQIHLHHRQSTAGARAWIERARELTEDDSAVLHARADVERAEGDDTALAEILERLVSRAGAKVPRALALEWAEALARRGRSTEAIAALDRTGVSEGPPDLRSLELRANLLRETGARRELAEVLETWVGLEAGQSPSARADRLRELARLYEEDLDDAATAEHHWQAARALTPGDPSVFAALERLQRKREDWHALRETLNAAIDAYAGEPPAELCARLGDLLLERFADAPAARARFEEALGRDAHFAPALAGLFRIAEQTGDQSLLLAVCEREAEVCDDPRRWSEVATRAQNILVARGELEAALRWAVRACERTPDSAAALEARADLEARLSRTDDELATRERLAPLLHGESRARCEARRAELFASRDALPEAAACLETACQSAPERLDWLLLLADNYRLLSRAPDEARCLERLAARLPEGECEAVLERLAARLTDPIGDLEAAIAIRRKLLAASAAPPQAAEALASLLELAGRHGELVELLASERDRLPDNAPRARELDLRRGRLLLDALGDSEGAAAIFSRLVERDPSDDEVLALFERALRVGHDATGLCALLARRAEWSRDPIARAPLLLERAQLLEEVLGRPREAADAYAALVEQVPASQPSCVLARARLEALCESTGQWARLAALLRARVDSAPANERTAVRLRIAEISRDQLQDPVGCAQQLERVVAEEPAQVAVWQQLQEIFTRVLDRPADWLRVAEAELASIPAARRELVLRVAIGRLLLDPKRRPPGREADEAIAHYERAFALDPGHAEVAEILARQYERDSAPAKVARVLEAHLSRLDADRAEERHALALRLARLQVESLGDDAAARRLLERVRTARGATPEVAEPLAALLERAGGREDLEQLVALCRDAIRKLPNERLRLVWRVRLGHACVRVGDLEAAAEAYRAALLQAPGDQTIEDALMAVYEQLGDREPLIDLLERRLAFASAESELALRLRLADLHAEQPEGADAALGHLEQVLDRVPHHRDALDRALALAERVADPTRSRALLDRALSLPLATAQRAACLERRALLPPSSDDAGERTRADERAIADLREVLALDSGRHAARRALRERLLNLERWPAALDCLASEAAEARGDERVALLERGAALAAEKLGPDAALSWFARLRAERPGDAELWSRLARVHRAAGRFEAALRALDEELALRPEREARHALELERAHLFEHELASPGRAVLAYQAALALAQDRAPILAELDRLLAAQNRPLERAEVLEERAARLAGRDGIELRRQLAELYCVALAKPESALPHLRANVDATADSASETLHHLGALAAALRAANREEEWVAVAEHELALLAEHAELRHQTPVEYQRFLREEVARILDQLLGDAERALERISELCDDPLLAGDGPNPRIERRLHALLRRTGRGAELADRLTRFTQSGQAEAAEWLELASLREQDGSDLATALDAYHAAEVDPALRLDALAGRVRCAERLRDDRALADALHETLDLDVSRPRDARAALARRLGALLWERLSAPDEARAAYQRALELEPRNEQALEAAIAIETARGGRSESVALHQRLIALLADDVAQRPRVADLKIRLAALHAAGEDEQAEAISAYQAAAAIRPLTPGDELALARLHERAGDEAAFALVFGRWCDREDANAGADDHLALAQRLAERGDLRAALARAGRAAAVAPEHAPAWAFVGELERRTGDLEAAIQAFERAAGHALPIEAARHAVEAGTLAETSDLDRAHAFFERAVRADAASHVAHAALARTAHRLARHAEATRHAELALELAHTRPIADGARFELALTGARSARASGDRAAALRLFKAAHAIDRDHGETLDGLADALFASGDLAAAYVLLERRLAQSSDQPERARQLWMNGCALEAQGDLERARSRHREALEIDAALDAAHESLVRIEERAARREPARAALAVWSRASRDAALRARAALRAGEHALASGDAVLAREHLEWAVHEQPDLGDAWVLLCDLGAKQLGESDLRALCTRALTVVAPGVHSARIALRLARLAEVAGDRDEAVARYGEAWRFDPRCGEAALCESRLARVAGDWLEADGILARFLDAHPDPESASLAQVHLERGRLLSGPLEAFADAIEAYQRALSLAPGLAVAKSSLAALLLHVPERWRDSLALHREILATAPTTAASLRALVTLAERRNLPEVAQAARCTVAALGHASREEQATAPPRLSLPVAAATAFESPDDERLRRLAHLLRDELGRILPETALPTTASDEVDGVLGRLVAIEDELSAPNLSRVPDEERRALFLAITGLFLDPGGNGGAAHHRDAIDSALGLWTRRKVRKLAEETTLAAVEGLDHAAWGTALRAHAAAQILDRDGVALRAVLLALLAIDGDASRPGEPLATELGGLVAHCESTRRLMTRITTVLCERLERSR